MGVHYGTVRSDIQRGVRYVVWDLEHTLTVSDHLPQAWTEVLVEAGLTEQQAQDAYHAGIGRPAEVTARAAFPGADPRFIAQLVMAADERSDEIGCEALPGAREALHAIERLGVTQFVSTGMTPERLQRLLEVLHWSETFSVVLATSLPQPKGIDHLQAFAEHCDQPLAQWAARAMIVGDGWREMQAGARAGLPWRVGVVSPWAVYSAEELRSAGATHIVDSLDAVTELIDRTHQE